MSTVSVRGDVTRLEIDNGDRCTTLQVYFMSLICICKNGLNGKYYGM